MSNYYSHNGRYPEALPFRIRLSNGLTRTDPSTFSAEEIADAGYTAVADPPSYNPDTEQLGWDGENWVVTPILSGGRIVLTRHEFLSRFSIEEETALEMLAASTDPEHAQMAATIRVFQRRLSIAEEIQLNHPDVTFGISNVRTIMRNLNVWPTDEIADARVAQILAPITS